MPSHATPEAHLYIHTPTPLFKARVNMPTVTYPVTALTFDGVTLGAYTDLEFDMTLVLGTADGLDDLGRVRVQKLATSTTIPVARVSRGVEDGSLEVQDNAYITVYADDFRVWAKLPYQSPDGIDYKDADVPVGDFLVDIPPVAVMGAGTAAYTSGGIITVSFDGSLSYAMAEGATISSYAWDIGDGTLTVGTLTSAAITATFPAGFRQVSLTVTDSNGTPQTTRRPVLAVNAASDVTVTKFAARQRLTQQGSTLDIELFQDLPRTTYPDGALVLFWVGAPSSASDRSHMKHIGWLQSEEANLRAQRQGLVRQTTLHSVDVAGRLDSLPAFPQALQREAVDDVDIQWSLMPDLDMSKALHYLVHWHSTALHVADFFMPPTGDEYPSMRLDSTGSTLYDQINGRALSMTPDHILTCNSRGQLSVLEDWMLVDVGDRPTVAHILVEDDYSDISFPYQRPPKVHVLRSSAVVTSTDWIMLGGEKTLPLAFCIAPGEVFSQGTSEAVEAEGLTQSQAQLNMTTGHKYARLNARFGPVRVSLLDPDDIWEFEPALMQRLQLNIAATYAAQRGLPFTTTQAMCKDLSITYRESKTGASIEAQATLELETSGPAAVTHVPEVEGTPEDYETPPPPPPTIPPEMGLSDGVQVVAGIGLDGYVYRTSNFQTVSGSGGPTWDRVNLTIASTIYSWVVDPFSPGYIDGVGAINGWIVNDTNIYRVTDLFGTPAKTSVFAFPTATVGASFHWRSIQASFGAYFVPGANPWLVCVSYYGSTTGHTGTWATYSTDGGVTWADEVQISAYYGTTPTRFMPVGLYASPKTPGLAYTVAYGEGAADPDKLPIWGTWSAASSSASYTSPQVAGSALSSISLNGDETEEDSKSLYMIPPANTVRVEIDGYWRANASFTGGSPDMIMQISLDQGTGVTKTTDFVWDNPDVDPPDFDENTQNFSLTWAYGGAGDWPVNRTSILTTPITGLGTPDGCRIELQLHGNGDVGDVQSSIEEAILTVTEIEFDGAIIYNPPTASIALFRSTDWGATWEAVTNFIDTGDGFGGSIHIPWPTNADEQLAYYGYFDSLTNDDFKLMRSQGSTQTDISPTASGVSYGPNSYGFAIRAYDSDRTYLALAGMGNDTSDLPADDKVGLWVSSNSGTAWTNILAPAAVANAPRGLQIAFSGTDPDILFAWGGKSDGTLASIYYSSNFGTLLDSREGNMNSLGVATLIGIAGGPTG